MEVRRVRYLLPTYISHFLNLKNLSYEKSFFNFVVPARRGGCVAAVAVGSLALRVGD